jgi:hypothetical protein
LKRARKHDSVKLHQRAPAVHGLCWARQGYLAHQKPTPPRTLQQDHAYGPTAVLGGRRFLVSEVPLCPRGSGKGRAPHSRERFFRYFTLSNREQLLYTHTPRPWPDSHTAYTHASPGRSSTPTHPRASPPSSTLRAMPAFAKLRAATLHTQRSAAGGRRTLKTWAIAAASRRSHPPAIAACSPPRLV